jgi:nucleoside triphosphate diphosphatase
MHSNDRPRNHIEPLLSIMAQLRDKKSGCPWDIAQTFTKIAPYTIEEAYEVSDAIIRDDMSALKDELGDLLFQTVFHARIAEESGHFDFEDVVDAICAKMIRRHPHVFGDADPPDWETLKAEERSSDTDRSALAGVALGIPALMRAEKLQKRAARTGFDWPDPNGARAKIDEELAEVEAAETPDAVEDEIGDVLFAVTNWARKLRVDPEAALRRANAKFERRFRAMELAGGAGFSNLSLDDKEALWAAIKVNQAATRA